MFVPLWASQGWFCGWPRKYLGVDGVYDRVAGHLIHGVSFAIGEMLDMNKITDLFIVLLAVFLFVVVAFVI